MCCAVIFYSALGSWTYGVVRLAAMFETKTREQENGTTFGAASRTRGGGGGSGGGDHGSADGSGLDDNSKELDSLRFPTYQRARPAAGTGLLHRRAPSRDSQA